MNRTYTLHDDTAQLLYEAAKECDFFFQTDFDTAAETLAAQNPNLRD